MNYNSFPNCYGFQWVPFPLLMAPFTSTSNSFLVQMNEQMPKELSAEADHSKLDLGGKSAFSQCQNKTIQQPIFGQIAQNYILQSMPQKRESFSIQPKQEKIQNTLKKKNKFDKKSNNLSQTKNQLIQPSKHNNFQQKQEQSQFQLKKRYSRKENTLKSQKQGRNKFSNILRCFLKFINNKIFNLQLIKKIIKIKGLRVTADEFNNWIERKSLDFRNYIRPKAIKRLFVEVDVFPDYNILIRVLFEHFLKNTYYVHLLSSAKMTKKSWVTHLAGVRQVFDQILNQKLK